MLATGHFLRTYVNALSYRIKLKLWVNLG